MAGANVALSSEKHQLFDQAGTLLHLVVDQWLFREIGRPGVAKEGFSTVRVLHDFCRRWAVTQFQQEPQRLLAAFPWPAKAAKPQQVFGSVLVRVYDEDPKRNFYRFAHRSVADYFLAEALLRGELELIELFAAGAEQAVQYARDIYVNSRVGKVALRHHTQLPLEDLRKEETVTFTFSDFNPLLLAAFSALKTVRLVEGERVVSEITLERNTGASVLRGLRAVGKVQQLDVSGLELGDDDLGALTYFHGLQILNLSDNELVYPDFKSFPTSLISLDLTKNPLGAVAGAVLLDRGQKTAASIAVGGNSFHVEQLLTMAERGGVFVVELRTYIDWRGAPLAYLLVDELPPEDAVAAL